MIAFCRAGASFIGPASLDKNEKKRLVKLWEDGAAFQSLPIKASIHPIPFWGMETERKLTDKKMDYTIRHIYIFSHQRREVIRHNRAKNFLKAKKELHKIIRCLNKYDYKTYATIHSRIKNKVYSKCPYYKIKLTQKEGLFSIQFKIDLLQLRYDEMFDGIYVLKTNLNYEEYPMNEVLGSFKGQSKIEDCFKNIKQPPICVSPIWLQNPKRIESLLFCVFVAFLIMALLQLKAREKVQPKGIPLRVEGRDNLPLTASILLEAFEKVAIYKVTLLVNGKRKIIRKCSNLSSEQRYVLWALSFPSIYEYR